MHYELYTRHADIQSEKITALLVGRSIPFVEIQLGRDDAEQMELLTGQPLPFVQHRERVVGGYSDLVNYLRNPAGQRLVFPPGGVKGSSSFSQPR